MNKTPHSRSEGIVRLSLNIMVVVTANADIASPYPILKKYIKYIHPMAETASETANIIHR